MESPLTADFEAIVALFALYVRLQLACAGRTNAQIAHVVGFSESTIRQETMAFYRTLGVDGRGQAAAMARAQRAETEKITLASVTSA